MSKYLKLLGVGAAACALCCLPLVLPLLGAGGLAGVFAFLCSAPGFLVLGAVLASVAAAIFFIERRRKARTACACPPAASEGA